MNKKKIKNLDYKSSGVDINNGNTLVKKISSIIYENKNKNILSSFGKFNALFEIPKEYKNPVIVSTTDGVGTKILLAKDMQHYDSIGIDLVAMCVNDLITVGAKPLFFLDYYATGKLNVNESYKIIKSIALGCKISNISLIGGETAEMPGLYRENDFDIAGFCVGVIEKKDIIHGKNIIPGDILIGLQSSGPHSNGYSLIRKILKINKINDSTIIKKLLSPTKIYTKCINSICKKIKIKGIAHITGGGITENLPRIIPQNLSYDIDYNSWKRPSIFQWIKDNGNITEKEMLKTFNCGIGMIICVSSHNTKKTIELLKKEDIESFILGCITKK